jgi:MFS family permease
VKLQTTPIPAEYRRNFLHLYFDIGWYGLLAGSAANFINIYAARLGASGLQIGLMGGMTAAINLVLAIPAGRWLERRPIGKAVFWTSLLYRLGYLSWVFLPLLFGKNNLAQINALLLINFLMGIPLTAVGLGFNALFAEATPANWRAYVAGIRNSVLSITFMLTSLASGYILSRLPFPLGYQVIFLIGFFGALMSSYHLYFIQPLPHLPETGLDDQSPAPNAPVHNPHTNLRLDILRSPFRTTLLVLFAFHLAQYLAIPLFPLAFVHSLHLTDAQIGTGTALFYLTVLLGSTQLSRLVRLSGHKNITGWGVVCMAIYPILLAISSQVWHFYGLSAVGGLAWALVGGAYANYLLEKIPANDRPAHLAWYTVAANACALIGSLAGPALANQIGLPAALILFGLLRAAAGASILLWG